MTTFKKKIRNKNNTEQIGCSDREWQDKGWVFKRIINIKSGLGEEIKDCEWENIEKRR